MLEICSLYLSHPGMSLRPISKGLGRLPHFLIAKRTSKRGCLETISTSSPKGVLCTELSDRKTKWVNSIPVSCSILTILPSSDYHFQGLSSRITLSAMTIFKAGPAAREWTCYPLQNWRTLRVQTHGAVYQG